MNLMHVLPAASVSNFMQKVLFLVFLGLAIFVALFGRCKRHKRILMCVFIPPFHSLTAVSVLLLLAIREDNVTVSPVIFLLCCCCFLYL